jgi:hypothetical protein
LRKQKYNFSCDADTKKPHATFLLALIFFTILPLSQLAWAATSFAASINLSAGTGTTEVTPQVNASGNGVYVVWRGNDGDNEIFFRNSTNSGTTFPDAPINLSSDTTLSTEPQIAVSGGNVFVIWRDDTANDSIFFKNSTNNGDSFNALITLSTSSTGSTEQTPQITASGNKAYVVWQGNDGDNEIFFRNSTNSGGITFRAPPINLSSDTTPSLTPQTAISSGGTNVFVVWRDDTADDTIFLRNSTDNGVSFNTKINLSTAATGTTETTPQITASGNKAYVVWQANNEIFFRNSTNSGGITFGTPPLNLSNNAGVSSAPQIAVVGNNVYVVWQDGTPGNNDILFRASTDNGVTFGSTINLSDNSGASTIPQLDASSTKVSVVWLDNTISTSSDIFFKASENSGASFGGLKELSTNTGTSASPQIAASGNNVYVTWQDDAADDSIFFRAGIQSSIEVSLDASQYKLSQTAQISVTDPSSNISGAQDTIITNVNSTSDSTGISITATETTTTSGIFTGTFTFTTGASSGSALQASPSNTIRGIFSGQPATASIFPRTLAFNDTQYELNQAARITLTDQNSNLNTGATDTASVTISSTVSSTTVTLTETGANTGIFQNTAIIFTTGNDVFSIGNNVTVSLVDGAANLNAGTIDTVSMTVTTTSDPTLYTFVIRETAVNTGIFQRSLRLTSGATSTSGGEIHAAGGDILDTDYLGEKTRGLILPNPDAGLAALEAPSIDVINAGIELVTASYLGTTTTAQLAVGSGGGGGGGGLIRPGMVLDVAAIISGGGADNSSPSFSFDIAAIDSLSLPDSVKQSILQSDPLVPKTPIIDPSFDLPLEINNNGYALSPYANTIQTNTLEIGKPVKLQFITFESSELEHIDLATNLRGINREFDTSDTHIIYEKGKPLTIIDPHGYFSDVKFTITKDGTKYVIVYDITFAKPMVKSDIFTRMWDEKRNSVDTKIFDAWEVVKSSTDVQSENTTPENTEATVVEPTKETNENEIPKEVILEWGGYSSNTISDSQLLESVGIEGEKIPKWFKATAKWVFSGDTNSQEFKNALMYLHKIGAIK